MKKPILDGGFGLSFLEIKSIIDQTYELGSRLLYIPGEGEPMLDRSFWKILEYAGEKGLAVILFTNGILLSNDKEAEKTWNISSNELVKKLKDYPVYIYHKFWSSKPALLAEMMGIEQGTYDFEEIRIKGESFFVPKGIQVLLELLPADRIGIEVVIEKRNYDEIVEVMIPFVIASGIRSYIEPIIHSGRCFGVFEFDPVIDAEKQRVLAPWISRQSCKRVSYEIVVHNNGHLSYGMAITPEQIVPPDIIENFNIRNHNGKLKDVYYQIHTNPWLVSGRYQINGCICEKLNLQLSKKILTT